MAGCKLTYFNLTALGEPIRLMLTYLGKDFEDYRLSIEEWPSHKSKMPFGKVPVLEIDGKVIHQATAITRYLGRQAKLAGNDDWEALQIDIAIDTLHDMRQAVNDYFYDENEASKASKEEPLMKETLPYYFGKFNELVKQNNGYLANGAMSWGDIFFVGFSPYLIHQIGFDFFEEYENLKQLRDNVLSLPAIEKWQKIKPKTDY